MCQLNQSQSLPGLQTSCSDSNGILSPFTVKEMRSFLTPFWIEKLQDLAGLILILAHVRSSSSLLRSQAVQAPVARRLQGWQSLAWLCFHSSNHLSPADQNDLKGSFKEDWRDQALNGNALLERMPTGYSLLCCIAELETAKVIRQEKLKGKGD